jgi:hypothetical protein
METSELDGTADRLHGESKGIGTSVATIGGNDVRNAALV